jgi:hypothetical protein
MYLAWVVFQPSQLLFFLGHFAKFLLLGLHSWVDFQLVLDYFFANPY